MNPLEKEYPVVLHQDVIWGDMEYAVFSEQHRAMMIQGILRA